MVAYTGGAMRLAEWRHPVVVDLAGMAIPSRHRPIRVGHNSDRLVGHTNAVAQDAGTLTASGVLSIPGPDTDRVVAGSRNGFPWQASIGAAVEQYEFVKDGQVAAANGREFTGPAFIVRKSTLAEISFVDLGAFEDVRTRLGGGAARKFNAVFWTRFMDSGSFFTAPRGNYVAGADSALDVNGAGLQKGILAFRKLKSPDGKRVGTGPQILLVPPELQFIAQRLYKSTTVNTGGASTNDAVPNDNIHAGKYQPLVCDWLSDTAFTGFSAKAWYLFRKPSILAPIVVSFLNGVQTPTVEVADSNFNKLGIQFRGYHDFGVDFAEWLAGIKVKGEA